MPTSDMSSKPPWKIVAEHKGTSRRAFQRTDEFKHTGNNEGTQTDSVKVLDSELNIIFETSMKIEWEYHGFISVAFSDDGTEIMLRGSDGQQRTARLV
ncbi:hypothetical protein ACFFUT_00965 [Pseudohalocynthiibacter aestuariivivens]|jgi:hypothetical protein|uniref:Uncharacterized protein n=1 Tax=Pseudohalocynthiibacter aestuariivivens TaxID=1591409 RepID=A0ABV5JCV6_9RHOB|nr:MULTISPECIES: hypothetical protein [Pseudohalocynthiibacter]MBS9716930.1 hypothetical protein [Pseudohalocynthiibacter aestuariivivens]